MVHVPQLRKRVSPVVKRLNKLSTITRHTIVWSGEVSIPLQRGMDFELCPPRHRQFGHASRFGVSNADVWLFVTGDVRVFREAAKESKQVPCHVEIARCETAAGYFVTAIFARLLASDVSPTYRIIVHSHTRKHLRPENFIFFEKVLGRGADGCVVVRQDEDL